MKIRAKVIVALLACTLSVGTIVEGDMDAKGDRRSTGDAWLALTASMDKMHMAMSSISGFSSAISLSVTKGGIEIASSVATQNPTDVLLPRAGDCR